MKRIIIFSLLLGSLMLVSSVGGSATCEQIVIICPQSFSGAVAPMISHIQGQGWTASIKTIEFIEASYPGATRRDKIKAAVQDFGNNGLEILTFVGDASYDDGQGSYEPEYDIIPMFYYENPEIGFWRDHRATLIDYVDFNGDRKPDVSWTVIPAQTVQDVQNSVQQELEYSAYSPSSPWLNRSLWIICDEDVEGNRGDRVWELADSLRRDPAMPAFNETILRDSEIPFGYLNRENAYVGEVDNGVGIVFAEGTSSSRTNLVEFAVGYFGFDVASKLTENHMLPDYMSWNCGLGEYDRKINTCCGRDFVSQYLFTQPGKGSAFWIAPTCNIRYVVPYKLGKYQMEQMYVYGARTTAEAFRGALRRVMQDFPLYQDIWECYNCYGWPTHVTHGMVVTVTGVDDTPKFQNALDQNYPNPFNPTTTIGYSLETSGQVSLKVYNVAGQLVQTLVDERKFAGTYEARWNGDSHSGKPVASGVYFYKLQTKDFIKTRKMVLIK